MWKTGTFRGAAPSSVLTALLSAAVVPLAGATPLGAPASTEPGQIRLAAFADCTEDKQWADVVGAEDVYREAIEVLEAGGPGAEAAALFEQSAALRVVCDRQVLSLLRMASWLYSRAGEIGKARNAMLRAAYVGVRTNRLLAAAHAYLDAAALSGELGETDAAMEAALKAQALAESPMLNDLARSTIMDRMGFGRAVPAAEKVEDLSSG